MFEPRLVVRARGSRGITNIAVGRIKCVGRFYPCLARIRRLARLDTMEEVEEEVIETICHKDLLPSVIAA